jgi:tetratricopeptide (TPR) repeat protein
MVALFGREILLDVDVRCAAYVVLYGRVHRVLGLAGEWVKGPGIKGCLDSLRRRSRCLWTNRSVCERASLTKNTFQALKEGNGLPRDDTLEKLAHAIATFDVWIDDGEPETAEEIEIELRAACAVVELGAWRSSTPAAREALDFHLANVRFFRSDLRQYRDVELAEIVARGTRSRWWPEIKGRLQSEIATAVMGMAGRQAVQAGEIAALFEKDPKAALHRSAEVYAEMAQGTRAAMGRVPGWEKTPSGDVVKVFESFEKIFRAMADGTDLPEASPILGDDFEAKSLCMQAIAPWSDATREEREALLWRAVETSPASSYARARLARFLDQDPARRDDAMYQIQMAVILDEEDDDARITYACWLGTAGRFDEALEQLDALEGRGRTTARAASLRGSCLIELGRWVEAEMAFERALSLQPRLASALWGQARCRREAGDLAGARKLEREAEFYERGKLPPK